MSEVSRSQIHAAIDPDKVFYTLPELAEAIARIRRSLLTLQENQKNQNDQNQDGQEEGREENQESQEESEDREGTQALLFALSYVHDSLAAETARCPLCREDRKLTHAAEIAHPSALLPLCRSCARHFAAFQAASRKVQELNENASGIELPDRYQLVVGIGDTRPKKASPPQTSGMIWMPGQKLH